MSNCPFCPLEHKTDWYFSHSFENEPAIVVCLDLKPGRYKYRILAVASNFHISANKFPKDLKKKMLSTAIAVANAHIENGMAKRVADVDMKHMKYPKHFHLQLGML